MRQIRSATITALALVTLAPSAAGCDFARAERNTGGEIVIAADLELTGAAAGLGTAYQRALELKVEQINESGVLGNRKIRLDVRDNRSDPNESMRNINAFTADPAVQAIVMGSCDECVIGASKTIADNRIPTITLAAADEVVTPIADRRYIFKLGPNAADDAAAITAELHREGITKVGLLHTDDSYGHNGLVSMRNELAKAHIKLVDVQSTRVTDTDVSQPVGTLLEAKPRALIVWTRTEQAGLAANSAREAGYKKPIFFDAAAAGTLFLDRKVKTAVEGTTMVFSETMAIDDVIATNPAKAARKQWFRSYTARYGDYHGFSSFAADAVQLITDAVLKSGSTTEKPDRDAIRDVLETSQMDGLSGSIRITPDNHSGLMPQALTILVARDGRWRLVS